MTYPLRNFVIEGVACQLRGLQATPLLQTSLLPLPVNCVEIFLREFCQSRVKSIFYMKRFLNGRKEVLEILLGKSLKSCTIVGVHLFSFVYTLRFLYVLVLLYLLVDFFLIESILSTGRSQ